MRNVKELLKEIEKENKFLKVDITSFRGYSDNYICDIVSELADSKVDIYNSDLLEWTKDNYSYIDEAVAELGHGKDFINDIQIGQYYYNNNEIYDNLKEYLRYFAYDYLLNTKGIEIIKDEDIDNIDNELDCIDNNNYLSDIELIIDNFVEYLEESEED